MLVGVVEGGGRESERLIWERRAEDGCVLFVYLGLFVLVDCVAEAFPEVWVAGDCHCCDCVSSCLLQW